MAEKPDPCVIYFNLDIKHFPPPEVLTPIHYFVIIITIEILCSNLVTCVYIMLFKTLEEQYSKLRLYISKNKQEKPSNRLVMRKPRQRRTRFTQDQLSELKYYFMQSNYVKVEKAEMLAAKFSMSINTIRVWFKNQRRRVKLRENASKEEHGLKKPNLRLRKKRQHTKHLCRKTLPPAPRLTIPTSLPEYPIQLLTPLPTPSPSPTYSDVNTRFNFDLSYQDHFKYRIHEDKVNDIDPDMIQDASYDLKYVRAHQWLNKLPMMTYNTSSPHYVPQTQSFQDSFIKFSRLSYNFPSPASTINSDTSDYFSQMSPNSDIFEPISPNSIYGESDSVFNGILDSLRAPTTESPVEFSTSLAPDIGR